MTYAEFIEQYEYLTLGGAKLYETPADISRELARLIKRHPWHHKRYLRESIEAENEIWTL